MIGYGHEDNNFVIELTYNYGISKYDLGNDFIGMLIHSGKAIEKIKASGNQYWKENDRSTLESPSGQVFWVDSVSEGMYN
jgi:hypothetical protein